MWIESSRRRLWRETHQAKTNEFCCSLHSIKPFPKNCTISYTFLWSLFGHGSERWPAIIAWSGSRPTGSRGAQGAETEHPCQWMHIAVEMGITQVNARIWRLPLPHAHVR